MLLSPKSVCTIGENAWVWIFMACNTVIEFSPTYKEHNLRLDLQLVQHSLIWLTWEEWGWWVNDSRWEDCMGATIVRTDFLPQRNWYKCCHYRSTELYNAVLCESVFMALFLFLQHFVTMLCRNFSASRQEDSETLCLRLTTFRNTSHPEWVWAEPCIASAGNSSVRAYSSAGEKGEDRDRERPLYCCCGVSGQQQEKNTITQ